MHSHFSINDGLKSFVDEMGALIQKSRVAKLMRCIFVLASMKAANVEDQKITCFYLVEPTL